MSNNQPKKGPLQWKDLPYALHPASPVPERDMLVLATDDDLALAGCSKLDHFAGQVFASLIAKSDVELSPGNIAAIADYAVAASYTLCKALAGQERRMMDFRHIELLAEKGTRHEDNQ